MSLTSEDFELVRRIVGKKAAIVLSPGKEYLVELRIHMLARDLGFDSIGDLLNHLRKTSDEEILDRLVDAMTTNETSFLRDRSSFQILCDHVLPEVLRQRQREKSLQIWSAACSTGQEPYSISMLLLEQFPELRDWRIRILASDLSLRALDRAREGLFTQFEVDRGLPPQLLTKYFTREESAWRVSDDVRSRVSFRQINLVESWPPLPTMDVVFLRNVLLYFEPENKRSILSAVHRQMSTHSFLFLGAAETPLGLSEEFDRVCLDRAVCYRPVSSLRKLDAPA